MLHLALVARGAFGIYYDRPQGNTVYDQIKNAAHVHGEFNVTFEREVMKETALRLSYIGNHGSNLEQRWRWNDPISIWSRYARVLLPIER